VLEVLRGTHVIVDCMLESGRVLHDYLAEGGTP